MKVLAYGSLQNRQSLEATLNRRASYGTVEVKGYQRVFNAPFGDYAFLNLQPNSESTFKCAYFEIDENELYKFDVREAGSTLTEVMPGYYAFIWPEGNCKELPVLQSYIDVCEKGAVKLGVKLWQGTMSPKEIMNDLLEPIYC